MILINCDPIKTTTPYTFVISSFFVILPVLYPLYMNSCQINMAVLQEALFFKALPWTLAQVHKFEGQMSLKRTVYSTFQPLSPTWLVCSCTKANKHQMRHVDWSQIIQTKLISLPTQRKMFLVHKIFFLL